MLIWRPEIFETSTLNWHVYIHIYISKIILKEKSIEQDKELEIIEVIITGERLP